MVQLRISRGNAERAARNRMISTSTRSGDGFDPGMQNVGAPERRFPVYKRRASPRCEHFRKVFFLAKQMNFMVDSSAYASILKRCKAPGCLKSGRAVHGRMVKRGVLDVYLGNLVIQMYGNCRSLGEARVVFKKMKERDVFTWSMLISANVVNGENQEALLVYWRMLQHGFVPEEGILSSVVSICGNTGDLSRARMIHSHSRALNYDESHLLLTNSLIKMYGKLRLLEQAIRLFEMMPSRDVTSYSAMITAFAKCNQPRNAIACFQMMWRDELKPSVITFTTALGACAEAGDLQAGSEIHQMSHKVGFHYIHPLNVAAFDMYARCGDLLRARVLFDRFREFDDVTWSSMIAAYTRHGELEMASELSERMLEAGHETSVMHIGLVSLCRSLEELKELDERIRSAPLVDGLVSVQNALITRFGRYGEAGLARDVFEEMKERTVVSWSAMAGAYARGGYSKEALVMLQRMDFEGVKPNNITYTSLADACSGEEDARYLHSRILSESPDVVLRNADLRMLFKCGLPELARGVFEEMEAFRDVITWTTFIAGVAEQDSEEAFSVFHRMELEGVKPTSVTFLSLIDGCSSLEALEAMHRRVRGEGFSGNSHLGTALIRGYSGFNRLGNARSCFDEIATKDVVSWTSMITCYSEQEQQQHSSNAVELFWEMQVEGMKPNHITLINMLPVCSSLRSVQLGLQIHSLLGETGAETRTGAGAELIAMYGHLGRIGDAKQVFRGMQEKGAAAAWNALITAVSNGDDRTGGSEAVKHLRAMQVEGVRPNRSTMSRVFLSCSRWGMVDEAWEAAVFMEQELGMSLSSENFGLLVEMMGSEGRMSELRAVMKSMELKGLDVKIWMSLVKACRKCKEVEFGAEAGEQALGIDPMNGDVYLELASMYRDAGNRDKEVEVLARMEYRAIRPLGYNYQFS